MHLCGVCGVVYACMWVVGNANSSAFYQVLIKRLIFCLCVFVHIRRIYSLLCTDVKAYYLTAHNSRRGLGLYVKIMIII